MLTYVNREPRIDRLVRNVVVIGSLGASQQRQGQVDRLLHVVTITVHS